MVRDISDEELELYRQECELDEDETNDSIDMSPHVTTPQPMNTNAWTSFILGIIGSLGWIFPVIGLPVTIVGTVLGAVGIKKKSSSGIAIAGFVINLVFLVCSISKGIVDIVLYLKKQKDN